MLRASCSNVLVVGRSERLAIGDDQQAGCREDLGRLAVERVVNEGRQCAVYNASWFLQYCSWWVVSC